MHPLTRHVLTWIADISAAIAGLLRRRRWHRLARRAALGAVQIEVQYGQQQQ